MASTIDPSKPQDGLPAEKAELRANLQAAKTELDHGGFAEGLSPFNYGPPPSSRVTDHLAAVDSALGAHTHVLAAVTDAGDAAGKNVGTGAGDVAAGNRGLASGGTSRQVLKKQSSTDFDAAWQDEVLQDAEITASRDAAVGDANSKMLRANSASDITYTVREDAVVDFPDGTILNIARWSTGALHIGGGTGVTIHKPSDRSLSARTQYSVISLWKQASNTWLAFGDLT